MSESDYLTPREAARMLRLQPQTLAVWRMHGKGPPYLKPGGRVLYRLDVLLAWIEERNTERVI